MEPEYVSVGSVWIEAGVDDPAIVKIVELDYEGNMARYEGENCGGSMPISVLERTFIPAVVSLVVNKQWRHQSKGYIVTIVDYGTEYVRYSHDGPNIAGSSGDRYGRLMSFIKNFAPLNSIPNHTKTGVKAWELCDQANRTMQERGAQYDKDDKQEERSIGKVVQFFNTLKGTNLTEEDGWLFMAILKMVRSQQGDYSPDSYLDLVAYAALMGEAASNERK